MGATVWKVERLDCAVALVGHFAVSYFLTGISPLRAGNANPIAAPANVFATSDGHLNLACGNQGQFVALAGALSLPDLLADPRYRTNADRIVNREPLHREIGKRIGSLTMAEAVTTLQAVGVACGPINTMSDVFSDPHVRHREIATSVPHASGRDVKLVRNPIRFSRADRAPARARPVGESRAQANQGFCAPR